MEKRIRIRWAAGITLILAVCLAGCGYRFVSGGGLPDWVERIYIPVFVNRTGESGIEVTFTNDLIYELTRNAVVRLTTDEAAADARIYGRITSLRTDTLTHLGHQVALERRVKVELEITITDANGKTLWADAGLTGEEAYPVDSRNKRVTEHNRRQAIDEISSRIAEGIYHRLTGGY